MWKSLVSKLTPVILGEERLTHCGIPAKVTLILIAIFLKGLLLLRSLLMAVIN
jgi:hypothetical protein